MNHRTKRRLPALKNKPSVTHRAHEPSPPRRPTLAERLDSAAILAAILGRGDAAERLTMAAEMRRAAA